MRHFPEKFQQVLILFLIFVFFSVAPRVSGAESTDVLTLPENLTVVRTEAFCGDKSIQKVVLQEGVTEVQTRAFADSSVSEISLPASLTYIAEDAFENTSLKTVTAPKGSYAYTWGREHRYITEYRALLIGETRFLRGEDISIVDRNGNDVQKMAAMLSRVYGPTGEKFQVTKKINAGLKRIRTTIQNTFAGTMDHDVSLFFIATHGDSSKPNGEGDLEMPFNFYEDPDDVEYWDKFDEYYDRYSAHNPLPFSMLAEWLASMVNGKVIVILESCGAGSAIYEENGAKRDGKTEEELAEDFVQAAVKAFAKADPGIVTTETGADPNRKSTGDMRQPKFYVLAAAAHQEESLGEPNNWEDPMNLFTRWLIAGVGEKGNSPADKDLDSILTLDELYQYIQVARDNYQGPGTIPSNKQHVQVYPENCSQAIFVLK